MIISLHLPKTAGSSFFKSLESVFGEKILTDFQDYPINTPPYIRNLSALHNCIKYGEQGFNNVECIHGHFLPVKYLLLASKQDLTFVTWMRNPVERLLSHYYFWQRSYDSEKAPALHKRVIEENWTLEQFCLSVELKNLYAQFLWGFPLENFDFIGITEHYGEDLGFFARHYLHKEITSYQININPKSKKYAIDDGFYQEVAMYHKLDMELYQRALAMRASRCCIS